MSDFDENPLFQNLPGKRPTSDEPIEVQEVKKILASPKKVIQPLPGQTGHVATSAHTPAVKPNDQPKENNSAIDMLRHKIDALYQDEPSAKEEIKEVAQIPDKALSKHQKFMQDLSESGKSLSDIQTEWHNYYTNLPDKEKHEVWQEFYSEHSKIDSRPAPKAKVHPPQQTAHPHEPAPAHPGASKQEARQDLRSIKEVKEQLLGKVKSRSHAKKKGSHLQSIAFGLGMGAFVMFIMLFSFFNERIIAPFITPSRTVSSTPIIVDPNSTKVGPEPMIIIPKINVEIPVVYNESSIQEAAVQKALEKGVIHYATTTKPGEIGNGVIFGHSSNNILNKGNYKFAFVLLNRLEKGDTFMLHKGGKRYVYKVFDKKVVPPTDVSVLGKSSRPATFSLITCDPPGTSINRLVVVGEQISPDPKANIASSATQNSSRNNIETLPSNAPSLWERLTNLF
jgi:sortase A